VNTIYKKIRMRKIMYIVCVVNIIESIICIVLLIKRNQLCIKSTPTISDHLRDIFFSKEKKNNIVSDLNLLKSLFFANVEIWKRICFTYFKF